MLIGTGFIKLPRGEKVCQIVMFYSFQPHSMMACHNHWHSAIYHVEKANYNAALDVFDNQVSSTVYTLLWYSLV